ncbi:MAG: self-incompatibility S1 family protein [Sweet potato little leaf phytoplasma]|nr:self-incompatibility S1 family protein [Sweet potato little leaf phytoplasma]
MMGKPSSAGSKIMKPLTSWKVVIYNELSPGFSLSVHCKSKNDDLGDHLLPVGQNFSWKFKEDLFSTTRFWCTLRTSSNKQVTMDVFWPEKHDWLSSRCGHGFCIWVAQDDGIYLLNIPKNSLEFVRKWEN